MLGGIRKIVDADRLAARVVELEEENARLRKEAASRLLNGPTFSEVKKPVRIEPGAPLGSLIVSRMVDEMGPVINEHLLKVLKSAQANMRPTHGNPTLYANIAAVDMCDAQLEVIMPEMRTCFRVAGFFR